VDVSQAPAQYPGDQQFEVMRLGLQSHKAAMDEAKTQAQTQEASSRANEAQTNATLAPQKLANQQAQQANEQANQTAMRKQGQQRISIEQARLAFDQKKASIDQSQSGMTGDDFLGTLPAGLQSQVKAMANGDIAIPSASGPQSAGAATAHGGHDL
jgi:hypothetical protein